MKVKCVRNDFDLMADGVVPLPKHWWPELGRTYTVTAVLIADEDAHWPNGATCGFVLMEIPYDRGFDHRAFVGVR